MGNDPVGIVAACSMGHLCVSVCARARVCHHCGVFWHLRLAPFHSRLLFCGVLLPLNWLVGSSGNVMKTVDAN